MSYEYSITNKRYHTLDYYFKTKYGKKVFKLPLNASFTCPNRDGSKGYGGCLFCSAKGSGDLAGDKELSLLEQYKQMLDVMNKKWKDGYYMIYFQAYSNTYGSIEKLKKTFEQFINIDSNIIGMSIATRPDCINQEIVDYLSILKNNFKEFWVELGLQTANLKVGKAMNLGYNYEDFKKAVLMLNKKNIKVVTHIINGLPNESYNSMLTTIKKINKLPIFGLKIHALNIIKDTILEKHYNENKFKLLTQDEYIDIVVKQLSILKENIVIHRISGDSAPNMLIAPSWVSKKINLNNLIDMKMEKDDVFQGNYE